MAKSAKDWLNDIERRYRALKKHWLDSADRCVKIYEADEDDRVPFNILYSNTETLIPALYNSTPRPVVERRFTQTAIDKALDTALASTGERLLEYIADSNVLEYQTLDAVAKDCVLGALVPGAGIARIRYHDQGGYQELCFESVPYDRFVWAFARKWCDVPWVAYGHDLSKDDFEEKFPEFAKTKAFRELKWDELSSRDDEEEAAKRRDEAGTKKEPTLLVWEVWYARRREIKFVCPKFRDAFVKEEPYPFDLTSRFPSPEPLRFVRRNSNLTPVPPYELYRRQAEELNEVTRRLHIVIKAIKVRGAYNAQLTEIAQILESDDTALVPVENASAMMETKGFEANIWLLPIQELITVARELYAAQLNAKNTIFEIMGIADVQRGASVASETAKAQEIKNRWGTLRVKRMQVDVQIFCRELFRIAFEFAANMFSPATIQSITKLPYLFEAEKRQLAVFTQSQQPPPPDVQAKLPFLQAPSWEQISQLLQDAYERTYRIDVETNSTVDLEATEDKAEIAEFMNAWGQMMSGFQPLIDSGAIPFEVAKVVMSEVFRRFRFARRVEMALDMIQPPQPREDPNAIKERHAAELQKVQAEAKRQIGEMQESLIEYTGEIERLRIENAALKTGKDLALQAGELRATKAETDGKIREHTLRNDYNGKMQLQMQQAADRERQIKERLLKEQVGGLLQQHKSYVEGVAQKVEQSLAAVEKEDSMKVEKLAQLMAENQKSVTDAITALAQQIQQVARLAAADREAEIFIGPDGKKRSRSRVVMQ